MCEAHNHAATDTATETPAEATTETAAHDHAAHDHSAHEHGAHDHAAQDAGHQHGSATADDGTAECPVMRGNHVDKADAESQGLVREYKGEQYYLCCAACGPLFDADPEKYVAVAA